MLFKIRLRSTGEIVSAEQYMAMHPNTGFPANLGVQHLNPEGMDCDPVFEPFPMPLYDPATQMLVPDGEVQQEDGRLVAQYQVVARPAEDRQLELSLLKARLCKEVREWRDHLNAVGGYKVITDLGPKWFHSDLKSQIQQTNLLLDARDIRAAGGDMFTPFTAPAGGDLMWKTMDKSVVPMTPDLAIKVAAAAKAQDMTLFYRSAVLEAIINNSQDPASIDIKAGWPETFTV